MTKDRLEGFSDAVFAIAITLLVIEVQVPDVDANRSLAGALADQWPAYAAYAISFAVIGIIWINHHHVFDEVATVTRELALMNLLVLSAIAFLPFPTALFAEYALAGGERAHTAAAVYSGTLLLMSLAWMLLWRFIARRGLHHPDIDTAGIARRTRRAAVAPVAYASAVAVSFISAPLTLVAHAALGVYYALDVMSDRTVSAAALPTRPTCANPQVPEGSKVVP